jgi:hypothetical protein
MQIVNQETATNYFLNSCYQILMLYSLKKYHKMIYVNLSSYISCQQKEWEQKLITRPDEEWH